LRAVAKRVADVKPGRLFLPLSSGYDSGAIHLALVLLDVPHDGLVRTVCAARCTKRVTKFKDQLTSTKKAYYSVLKQVLARRSNHVATQTLVPDVPIECWSCGLHL
jgi:hypothetical protein